MLEALGVAVLTMAVTVVAVAAICRVTDVDKE